jgi:hypothetical protein
MDDPRAPHTLLHTDADLREHLPISAQRTGVSTLADWDRQLRRSARFVQGASLDLEDHFGLFARIRSKVHFLRLAYRRWRRRK